jgi:hypothetical protein
MDSSNAETHGEELRQQLIKGIRELNQEGIAHQVICSVFGLKLEDVQQVLARTPSQDPRLRESFRQKSKKYRPVKDSKLMTSPVMVSGNCIEQRCLEAHPIMSSEQVILSPKKKAMISEICMESSIYCPQTPQLHEDTLPTFIYSYDNGTPILYWTTLVTGVQSQHQLPSYTFKVGCCWSEVPGGNLLITGGGDPAVGKVVRIDTRREFAVYNCPPMLTPRRDHAAVYHTPHLYILGGWNDGKFLSGCLRYVCAKNRWEALPPLPRACCSMSGVVVESSLYALGGYGRDILDLVQKLSLESFAWKLLQLRLPFADYNIPWFKLRDTELYLVLNQTLYSFTSLEVRPLKTLTKDINSCFGVSYYCNDTLYCSNDRGAVFSLEIGSLSN